MEQQPNSVRMPLMFRLSVDDGQNSHVSTAAPTTHPATLQCRPNDKSTKRDKRDRRKKAATELGDHQLVSAQVFPTSELPITSILQKPAATVGQSVHHNHDQLADRAETGHTPADDECRPVPAAQPCKYTCQSTLYYTFDTAERNCVGCGQRTKRGLTSPSYAHFCESCSSCHPKCDQCNRRFDHNHPFVMRYYTVQQMVCEGCESKDNELIVPPFHQGVRFTKHDARLGHCTVCGTNPVGPSFIEKDQPVCDRCWIISDLSAQFVEKDQYIQRLLEEQEAIITKHQLTAKHHIAIINHLAGQLKRLGQEPLSNQDSDEKMCTSASCEASTPS